LAVLQEDVEPTQLGVDDLLSCVIIIGVEVKDGS
jgi:uncharacterized membrane protein